MSFVAAIDHLHSLTQELAPSAPRRKFDLAHMRILAAALGDPQKQFPSVLIAGTNGKGSTGATLAGILTAAGLRTALYTSPHLSRVTERIRISDSNEQRTTDNGQRTSHLTEIPEEAFARLYFHVDDTAQQLVAAGQLPHPPSFFECLTALAFLYFAERHVDIAVLEVGMGGRLDATNIVDPLLSIITDIALDHQDYLGNTIAEIAREKAGILRHDGTLVTLPQHPEANQAIGEIAVALNVRAINAADFLPARNAIASPDYLPARDAIASRDLLQPTADPVPSQPTVDPVPSQPTADLVLLKGTASAVPSMPLSEGGALAPEVNLSAEAPFLAGVLPQNHYDLHLSRETLHVRSPLAGEHQRRNIALAIAAAIELRNRISDESKSAAHEPRTPNPGPRYYIPNAAIEAGIASTSWPGRLEFLPPNLLLDVAHNPAGAWTLRAAIATLPEPQPRTLIFSCLRDKDLTEMAQILFPLFDSTAGRPLDHIVLAPIHNPRAASIEDLLAAARTLDVPAHAAHSPADALSLARSLTPTGGLIVATGSIYLVGALRETVLAQ